MKKFSILMVMVLMVSACTGDMVLDADGNVSVDLLPGEPQENGTQSEQQTTTSEELLRNPLVIVLLILVVILIVLLAFTMGQRKG